MSKVSDNLLALVGAATTPTAVAASSGGVQMYGFAGPDGIVLEGAEEGLLPYPVATLAEYSPGDRVAITLVGQRPVIIGRVGGNADSESIWNVEQGLEGVASEVLEQSQVLVAHADKITQIEEGVDATKDLLEATDVFVAGLISTGMVPPDDPLPGQVWFARNSADEIVEMWRATEDGWQVTPLQQGLTVGEAEDGTQSLLGPGGLVLTALVADIVRTDVLYADVAGVKTLVVTDIPRGNLASDVGDALSTAEELGSRILLDGASGTLTIARNRPTPNTPLTAVTLGATSLDFVVDDKAVAYIDSELEQMSIANILARDTLHVGEHQVRTLPGSNGITVWQHVGTVA